MRFVTAHLDSCRKKNEKFLNFNHLLKSNRRTTLFSYSLLFVFLDNKKANIEREKTIINAVFTAVDDLDIREVNDWPSSSCPLITLSTIEKEQEYEKQIETNVNNLVVFFHVLFSGLK